MREKIQPSHIEREACVYIRQSTMQQVRTRLEGQRRQYDATTWNNSGIILMLPPR